MSMTVLRTRRRQKLYEKYLANPPVGCEFCRVNEGDPQFVTATKSFKVIHNRFPYTFWDDQQVADHLLIVPKEHTDSLASFTPEQAVEYLALIGDYEKNGYHVYARAVKSASRTITHQHTHLIKGVGKTQRFVLQITNPHVLITR
jgi:diadenosine tetraphosphate (Ap4A) HIT family hydrolase